MPDGPRRYVFPELAARTFYRLPAMLADSLPDRFGNPLVTARLVEEGVAPEQITPLDRLAYAADRAMGALEYRPPVDEPTHDTTAIQLADLVVAARQALQGRFTGDDATLDALKQLIQVGTSAGGARPEGGRVLQPGDRPDSFGPAHGARRIRVLAAQARRCGRGVVRSGRRLRAHRVRVLAHGAARRHRHGAVPAVEGERPGALHDEALRPAGRTGRRSIPRRCAPSTTSTSTFPTPTATPSTSTSSTGSGWDRPPSSRRSGVWSSTWRRPTATTTRRTSRSVATRPAAGRSHRPTT